MRRMPPNKVIPRPRRPRCTHSCRTDPLSKPTHARRQIEQNLSGLINLLPEQTDELLQRVDQPLEEAACPRTGRKFLLCDYNRDGDSYRSPWSNEYDPPIEDGFRPSEKLRILEQKANSVFDAYRALQVEGGHALPPRRSAGRRARRALR